MVDHIASDRRSWLMSRVKSKNTTPEMRVRRAAHAMGYRFRLHRKDLPGKPDLVFPRHKLVIFVHGCFWHRHAKCKKSTSPKTNVEFWESKFTANIQRDQKNLTALSELGWTSEFIWECETKHQSTLVNQLNQIFISLP